MNQLRSFQNAVAPFQLTPVHMLLWQKASKANSKGLAPISLRITINGVRTEISTGLRLRQTEYDAAGNLITEGEWNSEKGCVRGENVWATQQNEQLQLLLAHVREVANLMKAHGRKLTARTLKAQLHAPFIGREICFIDLCQQQAQLHYAQGNESTRRSFQWALDRLKEWRGKLGVLPVDEFTPVLAQQFYQWLLTARRQKASTAGMAITLLKTLFHRAVEAELVDLGQNPFRRLRRQKNTPVQRLRLSVPQFAALRDAELPTLLREARDVYVAQYYLHGSRVGVVLLLQWDDIHQGNIHYQAEKGGPAKCVAITPALQQVLDRYEPRRAAGKRFVFPFLPEQLVEADKASCFDARKRAIALINERLSRVAQLVGLEGKLHSHTARHTLAMHAAEMTNVRVAQAMLGHTNQRQTEKYIGQMRSETLLAAEASIYGASALVPDPTPPAPALGFAPQPEQENGRIIQFRFSA